MLSIRLPGFLQRLFQPRRIPDKGLEKLAFILGLPAYRLEKVRLGRRYYYRTFTIAKRDGRERRILAPSPELKTLQRRLLHNYLETCPLHSAATAFTSKSSVVENARTHSGQEVVLLTDLQDFFESTSDERVRTYFREQGWNGAALNILMRLCTYNHHLPQGAPTSPLLSNLINWKMDEALTQLAGRSGGCYTRYGDDLTFSWNQAEIPANFKGAVEIILRNAGYQIQPRKGWRIYRAGQEPEITGIVLGKDKKLHPPTRILWTMRWLRWCTFWQPEGKAAARLRGYEAYLHQME